LNPTAPANPFFSWQANAQAGQPITVDVSTILSKVAGTVNSVTGYSGTDSMPGCTSGICWYVVNNLQTINQQELDFFTASMPDGVTVNFRGRQYYNAVTTTLYNYGIFAPPNA